MSDDNEDDITKEEKDGIDKFLSKIDAVQSRKELDKVYKEAGMTAQDGLDLKALQFTTAQMSKTKGLSTVVNKVQELIESALSDDQQPLTMPMLLEMFKVLTEAESRQVTNIFSYLKPKEAPQVQTNILIGNADVGGGGGGSGGVGGNLPDVNDLDISSEDLKSFNKILNFVKKAKAIEGDGGGEGSESVVEGEIVEEGGERENPPPEPEPE